MASYFDWLYRQSFEDDVHTELAHQLFVTDFKWSYPLDENRAIYGLELRDMYKRSLNRELREHCSVLEMMVALSRQIRWEMGGFEDEPTEFWFFCMRESMGLIGFNDDTYTHDDRTPKKVDRILNKMMNHRYEPNGYGGLFHIQNTDEDMRELDIWSQMARWCFARMD